MEKDLASVVRAGDHRASLEVIRDRLAAELAAATGKDTAALAKELRATIADIEGLPGGEESRLDELAAVRAARLADAESS